MDDIVPQFSFSFFVNISSLILFYFFTNFPTMHSSNYKINCQGTTNCSDYLFPSLTLSEIHTN